MHHIFILLQSQVEVAKESCNHFVTTSPTKSLKCKQHFENQITGGTIWRFENVEKINLSLGMFVLHVFMLNENFLNKWDIYNATFHYK